LEITDSVGSGKLLADEEYFIVESIYMDDEGWSAAPAVTISGGTVNKLTLGDGASVGILGGTATLAFYGEDYFLDWETEEPNAEAYAAYIGSLIFTTDPAGYLPDGCVAVDKGDGTYGARVVNYVAEVNGVKYESLEKAIEAAQNNDTIILLTDCTVSADINIEGKTLSITGATLIVPSGVTFAIKDSNVSIEKLNTADDVVQVSGVCTLNFASVTGGTIKICDDAVLVDCNINGTCWLAGPVTFRGNNVILMISDFGAVYGAPGAKWTVEEGASLTLTKNDRYGLGYGDSAVM
jgi:hypothetical protein